MFDAELEQLRREIGLDYISDLREPQNRKLAMAVLRTWQNRAAVDYITSYIYAPKIAITPGIKIGDAY